MNSTNKNESNTSRVYLGNNRTVQLLELVETIEEASGIEADKTHAPEVPGDVKQTWANIDKAQNYWITALVMN